MRLLRSAALCGVPLAPPGGAFLQWTQCIREEVLVGKNVVWANMDETAVPRLVPNRRGHVSARRSSEAQPAEDFERMPEDNHIVT